MVKRRVEWIPSLTALSAAGGLGVPVPAVPLVCPGQKLCAFMHCNKHQNPIASPYL